MHALKPIDKKKKKPESSGKVSAGHYTTGKKSAAIGASALNRKTVTLGAAVQTKVTVGKAGDQYEREADSVADKVSSGQSAGTVSRIPAGGLGAQRADEEPAQAKFVQKESEEGEESSSQMSEDLQEKCDGCEGEDTAQAKSEPGESEAKNDIATEADEAVPAKGDNRANEVSVQTKTDQTEQTESKTENGPAAQADEEVQEKCASCETEEQDQLKQRSEEGDQESDSVQAKSEQPDSVVPDNAQTDVVQRDAEDMNQEEESGDDREEAIATEDDPDSPDCDEGPTDSSEDESEESGSESGEDQTGGGTEAGGGTGAEDCGAEESGSSDEEPEGGPSTDPNAEQSCGGDEGGAEEQGESEGESGTEGGEQGIPEINPDAGPACSDEVAEPEDTSGEITQEDVAASESGGGGSGEGSSGAEAGGGQQADCQLAEEQPTADAGAEESAGTAQLMDDEPASVQAESEESESSADEGEAQTSAASVSSRSGGSEQSDCSAAESEATAQMKASAESRQADRSDIAAAAIRNRGAGEALQPVLKSKLENSLQADLGSVRVHSDGQAQLANRGLRAKAFTHKNHIWLGAGHSQSDEKLMAHEVTHTVQQGAVQQAPEMAAERCENDQDRQDAQTAPDSNKPDSAEKQDQAPDAESVQLSPLSEELERIWIDEGKGPFFARLRRLNVSDADVNSFVGTSLGGDDLWLARNILAYGAEANWPIHLRVQREMKNWADSGGKAAVFNILRRANGSQADNLQLQLTLFTEFATRPDDFWLSTNLLAYGRESEWPIHLRVQREMKGWADSGGKAAVFNILRQTGGGEAGNISLRDTLNRLFLARPDDHWLSTNLMLHGRESEWPIHLRVEREMKGWADTGGKAAVFEILRAANGAESVNLQLNLTLNGLFLTQPNDHWLSLTLMIYGPEASWPLEITLEWKLRSGDKPGFYAELDMLAASRAGDATLRGAFNSFVASALITWAEAFRAAAILELGPVRSWPTVVRNFSDGLDSGDFSLTAIPPVGAENLRQFCIRQAGAAAEGSALPATYRSRFNALWDAAAYSSFTTDFNPRLDSKGPRNRRAREVFKALYADAAVRVGYDSDTPSGFRQLCDTLMGPEGTNIIASPRLQRLRTQLNPPPVTASGTGDAAYTGLIGLVLPAAQALDSADRRYITRSHSWRLAVDAKVAGTSDAVTDALRADLWTVVTTSRAPAVPTATPSPAPVTSATSVPAPTLSPSQRSWISGITMVPPTSPVNAENAEETLAFQVRSATRNPGLTVRRHMQVEPASYVISGQNDETPWPRGRRSLPHSAEIDPDGGTTGSRTFTARLNMPPVSSTDFPEVTRTVTVNDKRLDWFKNDIDIGADYNDENEVDAIPYSGSVRYFGGQLPITVRPNLSRANPGIELFMEGTIKKGTNTVKTFNRTPFGRSDTQRELGFHIEREATTPPPTEAMEIEVKFYKSSGPAIKTVTHPFTVQPSISRSLTADANLLTADTNRLKRSKNSAGSLLYYMTHNFPPGSPEYRVGNAVARGAIQVEAVIVRSDSASWLAMHGGNPATQVAYACGNLSNPRVLRGAPGAAGWRWSRFPNHVFLNLTPRVNAPGNKRPNSQMASLLAHEGIHALDRVEPGDFGRYATEFRAYWVGGLGRGLSTAPDPTMSGRGPKSPRAREIFEFIYNHPLYSSFTRDNYDRNINHFRERVNNMLVPDGINLVLSTKLQALRSEIESYSGPATFFTKRVAILTRYAACSPDEKLEVRNNRAWRDLVEQIFTLTAHRVIIKIDLKIHI